MKITIWYHHCRFPLNTVYSNCFILCIKPLPKINPSRSTDSNRKGYLATFEVAYPLSMLSQLRALIVSICPIFNVESSSKRPDADRTRRNSSNAFHPCLFERSVILFKNYIDRYTLVRRLPRGSLLVSYGTLLKKPFSRIVIIFLCTLCMITISAVFSAFTKIHYSLTKRTCDFLELSTRTVQTV